MHFGIISPPVSGHIHPFGALGRELIRRGHRVSLIQMPDLAERARAEGLGFIGIGYTDHPPGSLAESLAQLARLEGFAALRFTIRAVRRTTEMICRDAPGCIRSSGIDALLVDQTEPAGGTVAEHLGLPFVTICNALALNREAGVPPPFTGWDYRDNQFMRARNRAGYAASDRVMAPVTNVLRTYRRNWGLRAHSSPDDSFSKLAQISQLPPAFDFPRRKLPKCFEYVGPLRDPAREAEVSFPWERLDGRPLVYASLGTLQNRKIEVFRCFAEACEGMPVQLLITHGGGLDGRAVASLPGNPLVVSYAPQMAVLAKARLTLTHAGLNTVLDSLANGVPVIAVPITYEQPAIASRIRWSGTGRVLPLPKLRVGKLREAIQTALSDSSYTAKAQAVKSSIQRAGGCVRAADIIEREIY
jgi:MGT family glycosyltransferase